MTERRDIGSRLENWARLFCQPRNDAAPYDQRAFDVDDALLLDGAMTGLPTAQRCLLWWCYVRQEPAEKVCGRLGIAQRPATHFIDAFRAAQQAVEAEIAHAAIPQEG